MITSMLFYIWGLLVLVYEFNCLRGMYLDKTDLLLDKIDNIKELKAMGVPTSQHPKLSPGEAGFIICMALYSVWCIIGFITSSQTFLFLLILILSTSTHYIRKAGHLREWYRIDALITIGLVVFMLLNRFQFHIPMNVWQWGKDFVMSL